MRSLILRPLLVGQRQPTVTDSPKRQRGKAFRRIPRLRIGLQERSDSSKSGAVQIRAVAHDSAVDTVDQHRLPARIGLEVRPRCWLKPGIESAVTTSWQRKRPDKSGTRRSDET